MSFDASSTSRLHLAMLFNAIALQVKVQLLSIRIEKENTLMNKKTKHHPAKI